MASLSVTNTFTAGTTIVASQVNANYSDIVNYINNRNSASASWDQLAVSGNSAITGNETIGGTFGVTGATTLSSTLAVTGVTTFSTITKFADGAAATPGIAFTSDTNTGIYRAAADNPVIVTGGTAAIDIGNTQVSIEAGRQFIIPSGQKLLIDGSGSGDTYIIESSANVMSFFTGGSSRATFSNSGLTLAAALAVASGGTGISTKFLVTGTYTGNGTSQNVAHGLGTTPNLIFVSNTGNGSIIQHMWCTSMNSTHSKDLNGNDFTNGITSVDGTNFAVGANTAVNSNTVPYRFFALIGQ